jgi:hypothetical protein
MPGFDGWVMMDCANDFDSWLAFLDEGYDQFQ